MFLCRSPTCISRCDRLKSGYNSHRPRLSRNHFCCRFRSGAAPWLTVAITSSPLISSTCPKSSLFTFVTRVSMLYRAPICNTILPSGGTRYKCLKIYNYFRQGWLYFGNQPKKLNSSVCGSSFSCFFSNKFWHFELIFNGSFL